ncbi:hypothetical protein B0T10DRAFT_543726 [Thelonectria olida]|uniref:BTB domain-containing protein n=1 Tax=Thelonectria olida TaxID=1576542 RepID=A0A9P8WIZ0_9HYPO|nr:hypothetical protein B0T10DRAFT_543726 [Thelonectria olida]
MAVHRHIINSYSPIPRPSRHSRPESSTRRFSLDTTTPYNKYFVAKRELRKRNSTMHRCSIDGRPKKRPPASTPVSARKNETSKKLRPASPPRVSPWACKSSTSFASPDFPALPRAGDKPPCPVLEPPVSVSATRSSRASSGSSYPQSGNGDAGVRIDADAEADASQLPLTTRSVSTCSDSSSRHLFEAAAKEATANLWTRPFGADVVVQSNTMTFRIHRNIVEPESGWFQDNLQPPNRDGSPVHVYMDCSGEAAAHCLRFAYTGNVTAELEVFEFDETSPWDVSHLARCVLAYAAAVYLRMGKLAARLLQNVEKTCKELGKLVVTWSYLGRPMDYHEWMRFSFHYHNALDILYYYGTQDLMVPMRLAMASVFDATLFWLVGQPVFNPSSWANVYPTLMLDLAEYRRLLRDSNPSMNSPVAPDAVLNKLFKSSKGDERVGMDLTDKSFSRTALDIEEGVELNYRRSSL